eukprot:3480110-Rhodomonas_salina.3
MGLDPTVVECGTWIVSTVVAAAFWMAMTPHSSPSHFAPSPNVTSTSSADVTSGKLAMVTVVEIPSEAAVAPRRVAEVGEALAVGGAKYSKSKEDVCVLSAEEMEPETRPETDDAGTETTAETLEEMPCTNAELTSETDAASPLTMTDTSLPAVSAAVHRRHARCRELKSHAEGQNILARSLRVSRRHGPAHGPGCVLRGQHARPDQHTVQVLETGSRRVTSAEGHGRREEARVGSARGSVFARCCREVADVERHLLRRSVHERERGWLDELDDRSACRVIAEADGHGGRRGSELEGCLLYTSDAADDM